MRAHVDSLVDDYQLGLLPAEARRMVEDHAVDCERCQGLLQRERERSAVLAASMRRAISAPDGRLEALWPGIATAVMPRPRSLSGFQWRTALATMAVAAVILLALVGPGRGLDSWLLYTYTPTMAVGTASPTVSTTPTWSHPSHTPARTAGDEVALRELIWGTPEPPAFQVAPMPKMIPLAPTVKE